MTSFSTVPSFSRSGPGREVEVGVEDGGGGDIERDGGNDDVGGGCVEGRGDVVTVDDVGTKDDERGADDVSTWQDVSTSSTIIRNIQRDFNDNIIYRYCNTMTRRRKVVFIPKSVLSAPGRFNAEVLRHQIHGAVPPAHAAGITAG